MKYTALLIFTIVVAVILTSCGNSSNAPTSTSSKSTNIERGYNNQYIITFNLDKSNTIQGAIDAASYAKTILSSNGINPSNLIFAYNNAIHGFASILSPEEVSKLSTDKRIGLIEPDRFITIPDQTPVENNDKIIQNKTLTSQTTPWGISAVGHADYTGSNMAWLIDTGVDLDHPDLNVKSSRCTTFVTSGQDSRTNDDLNGHGTHCAGIIAAINNSKGVIGVASGAYVVGVKVLNSSGSGTYSQVIAGVDYVAAKASKGDVANLSLGGPQSTSLDNAVNTLAGDGIYVTIAAGNSGANTSSYSPADVTASNTFVISACSSSGAYPYWSNYGKNVVWCAPGVSVYSCYKNESYATMSGTSMAAPHVAGILLSNGGTINSRGYVSGDLDGDNPGDKLASR